MIDDVGHEGFSCLLNWWFCREFQEEWTEEEYLAEDGGILGRVRPMSFWMLFSNGNINMFLYAACMAMMVVADAGGLGEGP